MELNQNLGDWLRWLNRVRFLVITLLLGIVIVLQQYTQVVIPLRYFVPLVILWYTLALFDVILLHWVPIAGWHAPLEIICDLLMVTGLVYVTGVTKAILYRSICCSLSSPAFFSRAVPHFWWPDLV